MLPSSALVLSAPSELQCDEDATLDINSIRVDDYDAQDFFGYHLSANLTVSAATGGKISLRSLRGLRVTHGDFFGAQELHFTGPLGAMQQALGSLTYTPAGDFSGMDSLLVSVRDSHVLGGQRVQGPAAVSREVRVQVLPRNDSPVVSAPSRLSCEEGGSAVFALSLTDDDSLDSSSGSDSGSSSSQYVLRFTVDHGDLSFLAPVPSASSASSWQQAGSDPLEPCLAGEALAFPRCRLAGNLSSVNEALSQLR